MPKTLTSTVIKPRRRPKHYFQSFSQEGEDMILRRIFEHQRTGFFVDVGAHHPKRFSNTYRFYTRGWRGINIDAMPGGMKPFRRTRQGDINIEAAISKSPQILTYFVFNETALNTFDPTLVPQRDGFLHFKLLRKIPIQTRTLKDVLDEHLPARQRIDFLTVDVEGLDLPALQSNDWEKYRPAVVLVEDASISNWKQIGDSKITAYLRKWDYRPIASTFRTIIYRCS